VLRPFRDKKVILAILGGTVVAALLALAISGRSGLLDRAPAATDSSMSSARAPATTTSGPTSGPSPGSTSNAPTIRGPSPVVRVIQWMNEHGPTSGGASGPTEDAYYSMMRGDCAEALSIAERELSGLSRTLYAGVGSACLAAFERKAELWPRADAAFEKTTSHAARFDCESRAVFELLRRLVEAHRADPSARLAKRLVGKRALVCPYFTKITPNHGPEAGGYTVQLEGRNLPHVVSMTWINDRPDTPQFDTVHLEAVSQDGRHVVITVPPGTHSDDPAYVEPDGGRDWTDPGVQFTYDLPVKRTQPSSTTSTTTSQVTEPTSTTTASPSPS
jgi:hypothetical protein